MSTYCVSSGREERGDDLVRRHRLAQDEVAGLELVLESLLGGEEDERPAIGEEALVLEAAGDLGRVLAVGHGERDLARVGRRRIGQLRRRGPRGRGRRRTASERRRVVVGPADDRVADERPERGDAGSPSTIAAEDEGEDQELEDPRDAAPLALRCPSRCSRRCRATAGPGPGCSGAYCGCQASSYVPGSAGRACDPSRARPPERIVIQWSPCARRVPAARASSSSWRMIAAASRSIRARQASRWARLGGPPDRPRFIGPRRCSARWLVSRSSRYRTRASKAGRIASDERPRACRLARPPRPACRAAARRRSRRPRARGRGRRSPRRRARVVGAAERRQRHRAAVASATATPIRRSPTSSPSSRVTARRRRARRARAAGGRCARPATGAFEGPGGRTELGAPVRPGHGHVEPRVDARSRSRPTTARGRRSPAPYGASAASASAGSCPSPATEHRRVEDRDPRGPGRRLERHLAVLADGPLPDLHVEGSIDVEVGEGTVGEDGQVSFQATARARGSRSSTRRCSARS